MAFVMFGKKDFSFPVQFFLDQIGNPEFLFQPDGHGFQKRRPTKGCIGHIGFQQALELQERLLIKNHMIHITHSNTGLFKAKRHRLPWKIRVMLFACKGFFLGGSHNPSVLHQTSRSIVIITG